MGIIYKATNTLNGKAYIGQTKKTLKCRIAGHCEAAKHQKHRYPFINAIRKYGIDVFKWEILEENTPDERLNDAEISWIAYVKGTGATLYNVSAGGNHSALTPEGRQRISQASKGNKRAVGYSVGNKRALGYKHTPEARAKISAAGKGNKYNLGRKQSTDERAKRSASLKGKRIDFQHSQETKALIRLKRKRQVLIGKTYHVTLRAPDGAEYGPITNMAAFASEHGLSKSCLCELVSGKRPNHKGWICFPILE